jgi:molybdopterin-binding protein
VAALDAVGREVLVTLQVGATSLRARITPSALRDLELAAGSEVVVLIKTTSIHLLG